MRIDGENIIQDHQEILKQEGHPRVKLGYFTTLMPYKHCAYSSVVIDAVDGDINVLT